MPNIVIDSITREEIERVKALGYYGRQEENRYSLAQVMEWQRMEKEKGGLANDPRFMKHRLRTSTGIRIVYMVEQQQMGWVHHLAVNDDISLPMAAVIMELLDMGGMEDRAHQEHEPIFKMIHIYTMFN